MNCAKTPLICICYSQEFNWVNNKPIILKIDISQNAQ